MSVQYTSLLTRLIAGFLLLSPAVGCKKDEATPENPPGQWPGTGATPGTTPGGAETGGEGGLSTAGLTLDDLSPVIRASGEAGLIPDAILIELARPISPGPGATVEGTVLKSEPALDGSIRFLGPSTLELVPNTPLQPRTEYVFTLESVRGSSGVIPRGQAIFSHRLTTPELSFVRADLYSFDAKAGKAEVDLVFSGAVEASAVGRASSFTYAGRGLKVAGYDKTDRANVVRARLQDKRLEYGKTFNYVMLTGVPSAAKSSEVAPHGSAELKVPAGKEVQLLNAVMKETASGFYILVVCSDDAVGERDLYYYDDTVHESWEVTRRCVLDESDAKESVQITPAVKWGVTPSRGGFRIVGDFKRGSYTLRIKANARSIDGAVVKRPRTFNFTVPARNPQISFTSSGRYLPKSAWKRLPIRSLNLSEGEIRIRQVRRSNLVYWMTNESEAANAQTSDLVLNQKIQLGGEADVLTPHALDVEALLPKAPHGLLEIEVSGPKSNPSARARLLLTDLNLIAKHESGTNQVRVWAIGMEDGLPLSGVSVEQVVPSGRALSKCSTDYAGTCVLAGVPKDATDRTEPVAIMAERGGDFSYLKYEDVRTEIEDAAVEGEPYQTEIPYRSSLYTDRGVYRPGDTAHLSVVLRDRALLAPPEGMPVELRLIDPRQKVAKKVVAKINPAGMVAVDFPFGAFAETGAYRVDLYVADKSAGSHRLNVEEFVPERMKVEAKTQAPAYELSASAKVEVSARYLFGGSAAGSRIELSCELKPTSFKPEKAKKYDFGVWYEKTPQAIQLGSTSGEIGEAGSGTVECPSLSARGSLRGPAKLVAHASVFESGSGRTTQNEASAFVHPERYYVGLASGTRRLKSGTPVDVEGVVVDWDGNPIDTVKELKVALYKVEHEYDWAYEEFEGNWSYRNYQRLTRDQEETVKVDKGHFVVRLTPGSDAGAFIIRAESGNARTDLSLDGAGDWYWDWYGRGENDNTPRPLKPANVEMEAPVDIQVGSAVKVGFDAPFAGNALLTVETDRVLKSEWKAVKAGKQEWSFELSEFAPNVYASVLLVKDPRLESKSSFIPSRAFGVRSMRVIPSEFERAMKITAPTEVRSSARLEVELDLGALDEPTFATVAAVDEGILSLTRFESPDPEKDLFAKRGLGVTTFETIGWNLLLPSGDSNKSTGGDEGGAGAGRVQPVKPVALWSGLLEVPKSGKLKVGFDVPQYRGSLRVMAVAVGKKKLSHAATNVLVRDPLVLQTTMPRFLTYDDRVEVPVFVTNLSGKKRQVGVTLEAAALAVPGMLVPEGEAPPVIEIMGPAKRTLDLENEASATAIFTVRSLRAVGAAQIKVRAESGELSSDESLDVPFAPAAPRVRTVQRLELQPGKTNLLPQLAGWLPTTERSTIWITNNPYGQVFDHLKWLLHYPYGCIEQTTSSTRPLLYAGRLIGNVDPTIAAGAKTEDMVMAGINRILSMQTPEGGFGYWPGITQPTHWGTAYALHLLLDAHKLGYAVPDDRIKEALDWAEREIVYAFEQGGARDWVYGRDGEAYLHYVLASAGRGKKARMQKLLDELKGVTQDPYGEIAEQVLMLQSGLYLAGDHRYEAELKHPDLRPIIRDRRNSWSFYSDRRRRGFMLANYVDLFGRDQAVQPLADLVADSVADLRYAYTTQEIAWTVAGIGKYVGDTAASFEPAELYGNGKRLAIQSIPISKEEKAKSERTWSLYRASEYKSLEVETKATPGGQPLYAIISSEGIKPDARYETGGNQISIDRSYHLPSGEPITSQNVPLGTLIYVVLTLNNGSNDRVQNLAIVDRFPAGFEIENPRLGRGGNIDWIEAEQLFAPDYLDLRDDRIQLFGALEPRSEKKIAYAVRAVSAGRFATPPVEVEAMYEPAIWARKAGVPFTIVGPWKKD